MKVRFLVMFFLLLGTFVLLVVMKDYTPALTEMLKNIPEGFLEKFGVTEEFIKKLSEWNFYIITQWYGKNLGQFVPILAIIIAFPIFAREIENETIELLLVRLSEKALHREVLRSSCFHFRSAFRACSCSSTCELVHRRKTRYRTGVQIPPCGNDNNLPVVFHHGVLLCDLFRSSAASHRFDCYSCGNHRPWRICENSLHFEHLLLRFEG